MGEGWNRSVLTRGNGLFDHVFDHLSNFWEVDRLYDTKSTTVIHKLKSHSARNGIPNTVVSDSGAQHVSAKFQKFA